MHAKLVSFVELEIDGEPIHHDVFIEGGVLRPESCPGATHGETQPCSSVFFRVPRCGTAGGTPLMTARSLEATLANPRAAAGPR